MFFAFKQVASGIFPLTPPLASFVFPTRHFLFPLQHDSRLRNSASNSLTRRRSRSIGVSGRGDRSDSAGNMLSSRKSLRTSLRQFARLRLSEGVPGSTR
jgi:hypothetical protein